MTTEKELGEALKRGEDTIELEMDLSRKVLTLYFVEGLGSGCRKMEATK